MTILVIEGNQLIRGELHRALEAKGHRVFCAWDLQDVVGFLQSHEHETIDLALVDASMIDPGKELLQIIKNKHPAARVVVMAQPGAGDFTGYEVAPVPIDVSKVLSTSSM